MAEVIQFFPKKQKKVIRIKSKYPIDKETVRPFRIWIARERKAMQWRNYAYSWSAIDGAWAEIQWAKANTTLEVFNITTGQHIATLVRHPGGQFERHVMAAYNFKQVKGNRT